MSLIGKGLPLETAAARAGMSAPTARKYRAAGKLPSALRAQRTWRTRPDPFEGVWQEVVSLLETDPGLEAKTIFEALQERHSGCFQEGQIRSLQRRVREWRALHGPEKEVYFEQERRPGEQGQSDFTSMNRLEVTIQGVPFPHLLYHFVLPYSNWESISIAPSESFEALSERLQKALWELGGVPGESRTDNLSAATHELKESRGRAFTERYLELLDHYGMKPSKNRPGKANQNGDVESAHRGLKNAIDQRLRLRGSRDFASRAEYLAFLETIVCKRNATRQERFAEERRVLRRLPARRLESFREEFPTVARWSTVRVAKQIYSVPSRLIGERLVARVHAETIELEFKGQIVASMVRVRGGPGAASIDYRHVISSLVAKPGAFALYRYREALFPSLVFRRAYDVLEEKSTSWADLEYVRILNLVAKTLESKVEEALAVLLDRDEFPEYAACSNRKPAPV